VQHRHLHRPAILIGQIDDHPVGQDRDGKAGQAPQRPGDIEADRQVAGRLGQQDSPRFSGLRILRIGAGGLRLGQQRSLLLTAGPGGQPDGEPGERPVARAERAQGNRARQQATVTAAHSGPDFVRPGRQHPFPQPPRPRRIASADQRVQARSRHLASVITRQLPECAIRPHDGEISIRRPENNDREGAVLQNPGHGRPHETRTRPESNPAAAITGPRLIHSTIVIQRDVHPQIS